MVIRVGAKEYCFFWRDQVMPAHDGKAARRILSLLTEQPSALEALHRLPGELGETADLDDATLLAKLEEWVVAGRLLVGSDRVRGRSGIEDQGEVSPQRPAAAPAARESKREPEEEGPTFIRNDGSAQAGALRAAAEQGIPFCEECQRAANQQEAA